MWTCSEEFPSHCSPHSAVYGCRSTAVHQPCIHSGTLHGGQWAGPELLPHLWCDSTNTLSMRGADWSSVWWFIPLQRSSNAHQDPEPRPAHAVCTPWPHTEHPPPSLPCRNSGTRTTTKGPRLSHISRHTLQHFAAALLIGNLMGEIGAPFAGNFENSDWDFYQVTLTVVRGTEIIDYTAHPSVKHEYSKRMGFTPQRASGTFLSLLCRASRLEMAAANWAAFLPFGATREEWKTSPGGLNLQARAARCQIPSYHNWFYMWIKKILIPWWKQTRAAPQLLFSTQSVGTLHASLSSANVPGCSALQKVRTRRGCSAVTGSVLMTKMYETYS